MIHDHTEYIFLYDNTQAPVEENKEKEPKIWLGRPARKCKTAFAAMDGCMINIAAEMHKVSDGSQTIAGVCDMIGDGLRQCMKAGTNLFLNIDKLVPDFTKDFVWK